MSQERMRQDLRAYLLADSAITAIVSTRIYATAAPPGASIPYLVLTVVGREPIYSHDGPNAGSTTRFQFTGIGDKMSILAALRDAVIARLSGASMTEGQTRFQGIFETGTELEDFDDTAGTGGQSTQYQKIFDMNVQWQPAATV